MNTLLVLRRLRIMAAELTTLAEELEGQEAAAAASRPEVMKLQEFADAIRVCVDTARELCVGGKVPGAFQERAGGRWKIPRAAVEAYLAGQTTPGPQLVAARAGKRESPDYLRQLSRGRQA